MSSIETLQKFSLIHRGQIDSETHNGCLKQRIVLKLIYTIFSLYITTYDNV